VDLNERAFDIVRSRSGEKQEKPRAASARKGGTVGGPAHAASMKPERRRDIALKANAARWKRDSKGSFRMLLTSNDYQVSVAMTPSNLNNPQAIAEAGSKIYKDKYKAEFEEKYAGQYAAINVLDGSATVDLTAFSTLMKARKEHPTGLFHLIRIGHTGAFEVGFSHRHVSPSTDRIS
jgi:hypothetical protein